MRPASPYLHEMIYKTPPCQLNLSGSTPPFCGDADFLNDVEMVYDPIKLQNKKLELAQALAAQQKAQAHEFHYSVGSSLVFTQVLAAVSEPGDTVLIESPTYDAFVSSAQFLGLKVKFFKRSQDFEKDIRAFKKSRGKAKILVLSNPNCPTGQVYSREELLKLSNLVGTLIVDEVFLPLFARGRMSLLDGDRPKNILTIGSLSKSVGLSTLRLGWLRADNRVGKKFENIGLNLHIDMPAFSVCAGLKAVKHWSELTAPNLARADQNRQLVQKWAEKNPGRLSHNFAQGYFGTLSVPKPFRSGDEFAQYFLKKTNVWLRPTRLFHMPKAIRFHLLAPTTDWAKVAPSLLL